MACMLYIRVGKEEKWLGKFQSREAAEKHFRENYKRSGATPIYVETGKGRGR